MLKINGTEIAEVKYNNMDLEKVIYNGTIVFEKNISQENKIKFKTGSDFIKIKLSTKKGSPCKAWNNGVEIATIESGLSKTLSNYDKTKYVLIKGIDIQEFSQDYGLVKELDVHNCNNLQHLSCSYSQLSFINVDACLNLIYLGLNDNTFKTLGPLSCIKLKELFLDNNPLEILNILNLEQLEILYCSNTKLRNIDAHNLKKLRQLSCDISLLQELDIQGCNSLQRLSCVRNNLTTLNVQGCSKLSYINCMYNGITANGFRQLFDTLPERTEEPGVALLYYDGDNNYKNFTHPPELAAAFISAKNKGWRFYKNGEIQGNEL